MTLFCLLAACKSGYSKSGTKCVKKPAAAAANYQLATKSDAVASSGVKSFTGTNTGAIVSWYHTNSATDSTNGASCSRSFAHPSRPFLLASLTRPSIVPTGHSWCLYPYDDNVPGFAVSLSAMLADFNGDENAARAAYCGLGATFTTSSGVSQTLYIGELLLHRSMSLPRALGAARPPHRCPSLLVDFGSSTNDC